MFVIVGHGARILEMECCETTHLLSRLCCNVATISKQYDEHQRTPSSVKIVFFHDVSLSLQPFPLPVDVLSRQVRDRMRKKVRSIARMARMFKTLRQENETVVRLKGVCPGGILVVSICCF